MLKKIFTAVLAAAVSLSVFTGCDAFFTQSSNDSASGKTYTIAAVDGAPALAVASLIDGFTANGADTKIEVVASKDILNSGILGGKYDAAVMPLNEAAKMYNEGVKIKLASVNVFGSLYMLGAESVSALSDLKGKVVYNVGQGGTPDVTFKYLLDYYKISYAVSSEVLSQDAVYLQYVAATELPALLASGKAKFGILGEPAVTKAKGAAAKQGITLGTVFDIQAEYKKINEGINYVQAGLVLSEKVYSDDNYASALVAKLSENVDYLNNNLSSLSETLARAGSSLKLDYTAQLIARCNTGCVKADDAKADVEAYYNVLLKYSSKTIGGKLPDGAFYF